MQVKALENFTFYNDDPIQVYKGQIFDMDEDAAEFYISEGKAEAFEDGGGSSRTASLTLLKEVEISSGASYLPDPENYTYYGLEAEADGPYLEYLMLFRLVDEGKIPVFVEKRDNLTGTFDMAPAFVIATYKDGMYRAIAGGKIYESDVKSGRPLMYSVRKEPPK